jgi:hypothetical protein
MLAQVILIFAHLFSDMSKITCREID